MKFSSVFLFSSLAFAAPLLTARQQPNVGAIADSVKTLEETTKKTFDEIKKAVGSVDESDSAQVIGTLKDNFGAILSALEDATTSITEATPDAGTATADSGQGLDQPQLDQLTEAIEGSERIAKGLEATIDTTLADLPPDVKTGVQEDVDSIKGAVAPFVEPLTMFAGEVVKGSMVDVKGLQDALKKLDGVLQGIAETLDLPEIGEVIIPDVI